MPDYYVTIIGRFRNFTAEQLDAFRRGFSDRDAWQELPDTEEADWTWLPVSSEIEAESGTAAVEQELHAYEHDAQAAGLSPSDAWNVEARPVGERFGTVTKRSYKRSAD